MLFRDNYFFKYKHKLVKVSIASDKWNHDFNKTLIIPKKTTEKELKEILEQSLRPVEITSIIEERVLCLINPEEEMVRRNEKNIIDDVWKDGIEFSVAVYFSRKKTAYFSIVGDWKTTESEIRELMSFLCLDVYEVHVDEIGDCWVKRE